MSNKRENSQGRGEGDGHRTFWKFFVGPCFDLIVK